MGPKNSTIRGLPVHNSQITPKYDVGRKEFGKEPSHFRLRWSNNCDLAALDEFFMNPFEIWFLWNMNLIDSNIIFTNDKPQTSILNRVFSLCRLCIWMTLLKGSKVHLQSYKMSTSTNRPKTQGNHVCWSWSSCLLSSVRL